MIHIRQPSPHSARRHVIRPFWKHVTARYCRATRVTFFRLLERPGRQSYQAIEPPPMTAPLPAAIITETVHSHPNDTLGDPAAVKFP